MKILLKQSGTYAAEYFNSPLEEALKIAGLDYAYSLDENPDFAYFGYNNSYEQLNLLPENLKSKVNLDLTIKSHLYNLCEQASINFVPNQIIETQQSIIDFPHEYVFIKPVEGAASRTPYTFVYKIIKNDSSLLNTINQEEPNFFTVNEDGSKMSSKYTIQKAFGSTEAEFVQTYFMAGYVNGNGKIVTEGITDNKHSFNQLNDIDDKTYPIRNMRILALGNTEDLQDKYDIKLQLKKLVDFYSIKNTPLHTQWIIDVDGKAYLNDFAYNFQRSLIYYEEFCSREFFADKIKYIYDVQPDVEMPMTGWAGLVDLIITSEFIPTLEYAKSLGFKRVDNWKIVNTQSKIQIFRFKFDTEQECLDKVEMLRNYIRDNTPTNTLMF